MSPILNDTIDYVISLHLQLPFWYEVEVLRAQMPSCVTVQMRMLKIMVCIVFHLVSSSCVRELMKQYI